MKRVIRILLAVLVLGTIAYFAFKGSPKRLTLTGIVTTNDIVVSPQVAGQVAKLLVSEGDSVRQEPAARGSRPRPSCRRIEAYYAQNATALAAQAVAGEADLAMAQAQDSSASSPTWRTPGWCETGSPRSSRGAVT